MYFCCKSNKLVLNNLCLSVPKNLQSVHGALSAVFCPNHPLTKNSVIIYDSSLNASKGRMPPSPLPKCKQEIPCPKLFQTHTRNPPSNPDFEKFAPKFFFAFLLNNFCHTVPPAKLYYSTMKRTLYWATVCPHFFFTNFAFNAANNIGLQHIQNSLLPGLY